MHLGFGGVRISERIWYAQRINTCGYKRDLRELKSNRTVRLIRHSQSAIIGGLIVLDDPKMFQKSRNLIKVVEHYANIL